MSPIDWRAYFEQLLSAFPQIIRDARALETDNPEDDFFVRLGVVGFQLAAPIETWQRRHCEVIRDLRRGDYADEELTEYEDAAAPVAAFACIFYGLMLGLDQAGRLDERDREIGQALLPGFMLEDLERVAQAGRLAKGDG
jgi:hypothetical protein